MLPSPRPIGALVARWRIVGLTHTVVQHPPLVLLDKLEREPFHRGGSTALPLPVELIGGDEGRPSSSAARARVNWRTRCGSPAGLRRRRSTTVAAAHAAEPRGG